MKSRNTEPSTKQAKIARALINWLNQCPSLPVKRIEYEYLPSDSTGMGLMSVQSAHRVHTFIDGAYEAQFRFALFLRAMPEVGDERLNAAETLDTIGSWAESQPLPLFGEGMKGIRITVDTAAALYARYHDGSEDYSIGMTLYYDVPA